MTDLRGLSDEQLLALAAREGPRPTGSPSTWTDDELKMEAIRSRGGLDSVVRQVAKGVPFIGPYLDEANAATNAALHPVLGTGNPGATYRERYETNVGEERDIDRQFEERYPKTSTGLQVGGGIAGGVGALAAAPAAAGVAFGAGGRSLAGRAAAGGAAGGVLGGVTGYGNAENEGQLEQTVGGAVTGAGVGAVLNPAMPMIGRGVSHVMNKFSAARTGRDLGVPGGTVERMGRDVAGDQLTPAMVQQRATELGPAAMTMDLGRNLTGRAEALATLPGRAQNQILDAVEARVRDTAPRIGQDLDNAMGQSPNVVDLANRIDDYYRPQIRPAYDAVMNAHPVVTVPDAITRRPSVARAMHDAVELAREGGETIAGSTSLRYWDYVKKSLDSRIGTFARNPDLDSAGRADLGSLVETRRLLVQHLDRLTEGQYQRARQLAADRFAVREGLEDGLEVFKNNLLPEQFAERLQDMGAIPREAMKAGARRALERLREVSPANMSEGGRAVYRELLQGGPNGDTGQKLRMLLGDDVANNVIAAAQRETTFQNIYQDVAQNSRTARRLAAQQDMAGAPAPRMSITDTVNRAPMLPVEAVVRSQREQGAREIQEGAGNLLTANSPEMQRIVQELLRYNAVTGPRTANAPAWARAGIFPSTVEQQQDERSKLREFARSVLGRR